MTRDILFVGLGGGAGSVLRLLTAVLVNKYGAGNMPWATLLVNALGCLIIGLVLGLFERGQLTNPDWRMLLATGFCGGFTTFSAFAAENLALLQAGQLATALLYVTASVIIGVLAVFAGFALSAVLAH